MTETIDIHAVPADATSSAALDRAGLRYGTVDVHDAAAFGAWLQADARGFHAPLAKPDELQRELDGVAYRRTTGVWDDSAPHPETPVATLSSWIAELSVPGRRTVPDWAISSVTVAPTHRRRGVARALIEGELRTASALGVPIASLTVSEATIYGRYGFSPAVFTGEWRIDARRARWGGATSAGRVDFITSQEWVDEIAALHERVRATRPGDIDVWPLRWQNMAGVHDPGSEAARSVRAIRHVDEQGTTRGLALYRVSGGSDDFTRHTLTVEHLESETPDAYIGLWRHIVESDLVHEIRATLRASDEPLRWLLADTRGAVVEARDHQWLRVLDVPAALEARTWSAPGRIVLDVADELGFAAGTFSLEVDEAGAATVERVGDSGDDRADVRLHVRQLSSLYLGGVRATQLARVRLVEGEAEAVAAFDRMLASPDTPWLTVWY